MKGLLSKAYYTKAWISDRSYVSIDFTYVYMSIYAMPAHNNNCITFVDVGLSESANDRPEQYQRRTMVERAFNLIVIALLPIIVSSYNVSKNTFKCHRFKRERKNVCKLKDHSRRRNIVWTPCVKMCRRIKFNPSVSRKGYVGIEKI